MTTNKDNPTKENYYYMHKKSGIHIEVKKKKCINCKKEFMSNNDARMCEKCRRKLNDGRIEYSMVD